MFNTSKSFTDNIKRYSWLLVLPLIVGLFLSSCGDSPINADTNFTDSSSTDVNNDITFVPEQFDAVGTIQGTVIDKATGEALNDVAVSLNFSPEGGEPSVITDTTGSEGTFAFTGVPVNSEVTSTSSAQNVNSPYTLKLDAGELENYRDLYRINTAIIFEGTGGDGAATNLVSDVTIPLSEQAVTLNGLAHTDADANNENGAALSGVRVELYQDFNPIINGGSDTQVDMLVDSAETGEDGSFEFTGVEEKANVMLRFVDDSDPSEVINYEPGASIETPAADGTTPEVDLGIIDVDVDNRSGGFYLTSVTPEPGSDVETDTEFTYVFNRPVAENAYTNADAGFGTNTMNDDIEFSHEDDKSFKASGDVDFSVSFGETRDTLIIDPDESTMKDASEYALLVNAFDDSRFVDEFGNMVTYDASDYNDDFVGGFPEPGNVEALVFSTGDDKNAPHTPEIAVDSTSLNTDWDFGSHELSWDVIDDSAEVLEYEIYASKNGGPYSYLVTVEKDEAEFATISESIDATSNSNADDFDHDNGRTTTNKNLLVVDDSGTPDQSNTYELKVRAVSTNLVEGEFSDEVDFEDVTQPAFNSGTAETDGADIYIEVNEPLEKATAENASNYTVTDDTNGELSIDSVSYDFGDQDNPNGSTGFDIVITVENAGNVDTGEIEIESNVTDLAGNEVDSNADIVNY